jgi:hypothetical protein
MTDEQKKTLSSLEERQKIISMSYWENFKYTKELSQALGGNDPKVQSMANECNKISEEMRFYDQQIKEFKKSLKID